MLDAISLKSVTCSSLSLGRPCPSRVYRWDSDKYLQKSFSLAYNYVRSDAINFLKLFNDSSGATDDELQDYVAIFPHPYFNGANAVYVPGDNDDGGGRKNKPR